MKRWMIPFAFLLIVLAGAFYYQQQQASGRAGFPAPDFSLNDLSGHTHRLSDYRGKVIFLNLWATWCPPCRMEMPSMQRLHERLKGKNFVMLAVSEDEDGPTAVRPFVQQMGLTFPILVDPKGTLPPRYGVTGFPETFIIDRDGHVVQHTIGPENWESEQMYQYFLKLLGDGTGATQVRRDLSPSGS